MNTQGYRMHCELRRARRDYARKEWLRQGKKADLIAHIVVAAVLIFLSASVADWLTGEQITADFVAWVRK